MPDPNQPTNQERIDMPVDFEGRVAIVTGAGGGLGEQHALALAARGAKVVVNDLGGARDGSGGSETAAQAVVGRIRAAGGEAVANAASVTDFAAVQSMVAQAMDTWGRVDILVNNAGILRDKTFAKMELDDFRLVLDVHLMGAVHCTKAVWPIMVAQKYGRVVMTTSSSGLYGNFGQSNYGAAKMALVGLMQTLALEGARHDIRVNCLAPTAATRMTQGLMPEEVLRALEPQAVSPAMLVLACEQAPNRTILTQGVWLGSAPDVPQRLAERLDAVRDRQGEMVPESGSGQGQNEIAKALAALGRG
jgi:NAD(P)-dependent dehydrogenase (short-subunit alcohol dehydrogenase family)